MISVPPQIFKVYVFESSNFVEPQETKLFIDASLVKGASIQQLNDIVLDLESFLLKDQDKIGFQTTINSPQNANVRIRFLSKSDTYFPYQLRKGLFPF